VQLSLISPVYGNTSYRSIEPGRKQYNRHTTPRPAAQAGIVWLIVPYAQKDKAKRLGALWDSQKKHWYAKNDNRLDRFKRWIK